MHSRNSMASRYLKLKRASLNFVDQTLYGYFKNLFSSNFLFLVFVNCFTNPLLESLKNFSSNSRVDVFISVSGPAESFKSSLENCRSNSRINETDQRGFPSFFISALRHPGSFASDWNASQNKSEGSQREI